MPVPGARYTFGSFELDDAARRLTRAGTAVPLADRHFDVLVQLVSRAGATVSKDALVSAAWRDVAVTDNSLEQAISALRRSLGAGSDGQPYIVTVPRQGYRFAGEVARNASRQTDDQLDALLEPYRVFLEGRSALETLQRDRAAEAAAAFRNALESSAEYAPAHVGLANALAFEFEATRADATPDLGALREAVEHAREACRLDADSAEAWATLGFVLHRAGQTVHALAATRRATSLEPGNWRHHVRLAVVSWGEERLGAAARAQALMPGLALAHWLAATVHVARQAFDAAERELDAGAAAQDHQSAARFGGVGLHWLRGLVRLRRGDEAGAADDFRRELAFEAGGHLYARECCAHTWCAIGVTAMRHEDQQAAIGAFGEALRRVPVHVPALAALAAFGDPMFAPDVGKKVQQRIGALRAHGAVVDAAVAEAVVHAIGGDHRAAAAVVHSSLAEAPPSAAGWSVPVDPFLQVSLQPDVWAPVLAALASRAA